MKNLVCQAQHLELNLLLCAPSIAYYPSGSVLCSLNTLKLALCNTIPWSFLHLDKN